MTKFNSNTIKSFFIQFDDNAFSAYHSFFSAHMGYTPNVHWPCEHNAIQAAFEAHGWQYSQESTIEALKTFSKRFSRKIKQAVGSKRIEDKILWHAKTPDSQDIYRFFLEIGPQPVGIYKAMLEMYVYPGANPTYSGDAESICKAMQALGWTKGVEETTEALRGFISYYKESFKHAEPCMKVRLMDAKRAA
jgi:hypothetical protein